MKKVIFCLFILSAFLKLNAQYAEDCEMALDAIDEYIAFIKCIEENPDKMCDDAQTTQLTPISYCKEASDYLKNLIRNEEAEPMRCHLIRYAGWTGDAEGIPFLKELLKKEELSANEKNVILFAFLQVGKHSERRDIMDEAARLVNEFCSEQSGLYFDCTNAACAQLYYYMGGDAALAFFSYCFENEETRLQAALKLAFLGESEKTFPVFAKALFSENTNDILTALQGLNAIGTEAAYQLMKSQTQHEEVGIARTAQKFCMNYEKKGGNL